MSLSAKASITKICLFGMSERVVKSLDIIFERHMAGTCVVAEEASAHVTMIDLDAQGAKVELERQSSRYPERPIIVLSFSDLVPAIPNSVLVSKPVKVDQFVEVLRQLANRPAPESVASAGPESVASPVPLMVEDTADDRRKGRRVDLAPGQTQVGQTDRAVADLQSRERHYYIGSMPDVDLNVPEQRSKVFYDTSHFLQGFLQTAIKLGVDKGAVVFLSSPAFGRIEVYPFARKVLTSATGATLYAVSRIPLRPGDVTIELAPDAPQFPVADERVEALDAFLWKLALWASRGRLPVGTDLGSPVVLKHWPNLPRLLNPPQATRIAGLWSRRATSLPTTADVLRIPQRNVFAFYSACVALDLIVPDRRGVARPPVPETPLPQEKRTLFRMLMHKLTGSRGD
jgi:hypothetical protein